MAYTTIDDPELYFQVKLWTGNSTNDRAITFDNTDADLDPDLIWIKKRTNDAEDHALHDTVRGISSSAKLLNPNGTGAEETHGNNGFVSAVTADTFTLKTNDASGSDGYQYNNHNTDTYVAWCWKESATSGFDIVTYEGNGSARTISHSLSAVPKMIITKDYDASANWAVYHAGNTSAPETDWLILNTTAATADNADIWNDTAPTSSVFSVGTDDDVNDSGDSFITYLWSEKQGYSKFGKYLGNGSSTDGTFIYTGFRPAFILIKTTDLAGNNWQIYDNKREGYNPTNDLIRANTSAVEGDGTDPIDILSNGFKMYNTAGSANESDGNYTYMAFAEAPFVNSKGVPCNAR